MTQEEIGTKMGLEIKQVSRIIDIYPESEKSLLSQLERDDVPTVAKKQDMPELMVLRTSIKDKDEKVIKKGGGELDRHYIGIAHPHHDLIVLDISVRLHLPLSSSLSSFVRSSAIPRRRYSLCFCRLSHMSLYIPVLCLSPYLFVPCSFEH
jgi:transcriptional regulator with XRE-family HTH domain